MPPFVDLPGTVQVAAPTVPRVVMAAPATDVVVVPVGGPPGPKGPAGDSSELFGYETTLSSPVLLAQIHHNLPYKPAGITCLLSDGSQLEYAAVSHPAVGIIEIEFGVPFAGTVILS